MGAGFFRLIGIYLLRNILQSLVALRRQFGTWQQIDASRKTTCNYKKFSIPYSTIMGYATFRYSTSHHMTSNMVRSWQNAAAFRDIANTRNCFSLQRNDNFCCLYKCQKCGWWKSENYFVFYHVTLAMGFSLRLRGSCVRASRNSTGVKAPWLARQK